MNPPHWIEPEQRHLDNAIREAVARAMGARDPVLRITGRSAQDRVHRERSGIAAHDFAQNMSLRKIIKMRGSFPSEEAAIKLLYLALSKVIAKWQTVQNWKQMLNYLDTICGDRMREAGVRN